MRPKIFFAVPCGEFYWPQLNLIKDVCLGVGVLPVIVEHSLQTAELWPHIVSEIEKADYVMADVSSLRPNIILELGYALKAKHETRVAIFVSKNSKVPSDLSGMKWVGYAGYRDFGEQLHRWLTQVVKAEDNNSPPIYRTGTYFHDEFQDFDRFLRLWSTPPGCQFDLTAEGLRFTNAYYPLLTQTLGLMINLEMTFTARIVRERIGWVVKGTTEHSTNSRIFGVMFNLTADGLLKPHILSVKNIHAKPLYKEFEETKINLRKSNEGWFTIVTQCENDVITITNEGEAVFHADFKTDNRFSEHYAFEPKHGQVGFRCSGWGDSGESGEVAVVRSVEVREL